MNNEHWRVDIYYAGYHILEASDRQGVTARLMNEKERPKLKRRLEKLALEVADLTNMLLEVDEDADSLERQNEGAGSESAGHLPL